jgi:hypothetical protein
MFSVVRGGESAQVVHVGQVAAHGGHLVLGFHCAELVPSGIHLQQPEQRFSIHDYMRNRKGDSVSPCKVPPILGTGHVFPCAVVHGVVASMCCIDVYVLEILYCICWEVQILQDL